MFYFYIWQFYSFNHCFFKKKYSRDVYWDDNKKNLLTIKFENELWSYNPQLDLLAMRKQDNEYIYPCILGETKSNERDRYTSNIY